MPATFPAHPAAVLPLKLWRPAWFDGVALAAGSMAPDLAYALDGSPLERPLAGLPPLWELAHSLPWFLFWALPVTFALCPLIRLALPAFAAYLPAARLPAPSLPAAHLPAAVPPAARLPAPPSPAAHLPAAVPPAAHLPAAVPPAARLRAAVPPAARLRAAVPPAAASATAPPSRPHAFPAALCALVFRCCARLIGLVAGLLAPLRGWLALGRGPRWYVTDSSAGIGALSHVVWDRIAVGPLDLVSSLAGGFFGLWLMFVLARQMNVDGRSGVDSSGRGSAVVYWGTAAVVFAVGAVFLPSLPGYLLPHTTSARVILLTIAAFLLAAAASRLRPFRREPLQQ